MIEVKHVLDVLKKTKKAIETNNTFELKNLSNQTIHSSSIQQDSDNISIAVTIYALGKIFERVNFRSLKGWDNFYSITIKSLNNSISALEKNNIEEFRNHFQFIAKAINKISGKLKDYITQVFEKARINKASRIYEHGISLGKTAELLGVNLYDLSTYAGNTGISEVPLTKTMNAKSRIKLTEDFFK
ncbi:MAG: hypothetical protein WC812_01480 [Candidatus Pacearchaeota archaeon]|jgi:hypothetical protein